MKHNQTIIFLAWCCWTITPVSAFSQTPIAPVINRPNLQLGSQGSAVSELQAVLKLWGYYTGEVDGVYSYALANAVSQFQQAAGINADGIVDSRTWGKLFPLTSSTTTAAVSPPATETKKPPASGSNNTQASNTPSNNPTQASNTPSNNPTQTSNNPKPRAEDLPVLKEGMNGPYVRQLQEKLRTLGLFKSQVDGVFGQETLEAVVAVQKKFGLDADGVVGTATWRVLLK